jgi:hypothetical protein
MSRFFDKEIGLAASLRKDAPKFRSCGGVQSIVAAQEIRLDKGAHYASTFGS